MTSSSFRQNPKEVQKLTQVQFKDESNRAPVQRTFVGTQKDYADHLKVIDCEFEKKRKAVERKWKRNLNRAASITKLKRKMTIYNNTPRETVGTPSMSRSKILTFSDDTN